MKQHIFTQRVLIVKCIAMVKITLKEIITELALDSVTATGNRPGRNQRELLRYAVSKKLIKPSRFKKWEWDNQDADEIGKVKSLLSMKGPTSWKGVNPPKKWRSERMHV